MSIPNAMCRGEMVHRCYGSLYGGKCVDCLAEERDRLRDDLEIAVQRADRHKAMTLTLAGREGRFREALERIARLDPMDPESGGWALDVAAGALDPKDGPR